MEVKVSEQSPVAKQVNVEVEASRVDAAIRKRLNDIGKRVRVPGFRKGKVPARELERRYGKAARYEAIDDVVRAAMDEVLGDEQFNGSVHIGRPELVDGLEGPGGITFSFIAERLPEMAPTNYVGVQVEQLKTSVTDAELEDELEKLQQEYTTDVPVEDRTTIEKDDVVVCSYKGVGDGPAAEIFAEDQTIWLADENLLDGFADNIAGHERGETVDVSVSLPEDFQLEELAGQTITLSVTVSEIKARRVPAIDDDLAAETGEADTLEGLKAKITARIEGERSEREVTAARNRMVETIRAANPIELPPGFVDEQCVDEVRQRLRSMQQQGLDPASLNLDIERLKAAVRPQVEMGIHASVVLRAIADKEALEVTEEQIEARIAEIAEKAGVPLAKAKAQFAGDQARASLRAQMMHETVLAYLWERAEVTLVDELTDDTPAADGDAEADAADE